LRAVVGVIAVCNRTIGAISGAISGAIANLDLGLGIGGGRLGAIA